jgi:hypothetical protein
MAQRKHLGAELGVGAGADESVKKRVSWYARPRSMAGNLARSTRPSAAKTLWPSLAGLPAVGARGANSNGRWAVYPTGHNVPNPFFVADRFHDVAFPGGNARFDGAALCHELLPEASDLFWFEHADCHF